MLQKFRNLITIDIAMAMDMDIVAQKAKHLRVKLKLVKKIDLKYINHRNELFPIKTSIFSPI